jgi:23S rRNA (adenine2503-C2)-methyltransferase
MDIREADLGTLTDFITSNGEKAFRAKQIQEWIWKKGVRKFAELKNIPKTLQESLEKEFEFSALDTYEIHKSVDGTAKFTFVSNDQKYTEGVLIPRKTRVTACISTQIGCPLRCGFCATGKLGFDRNLSVGEIFDQITLMSAYSLDNYQSSISNIVIMGMGEPFLNFEACSGFIKKLTSPEFKGMSPKRITLSSVGLCDGIYALADRQLGVEFALSLHCAIQSERELIIPVAKNNTLDEITKALKYYHQKTDQRITIEYVLLKEINDQIKHAQALSEFCKSFPVKINIIEYNPTEDIPFSKSDERNSIKFVEYLESKNLIVNVRKSRGKDIGAACGQLAGIIKK